jgi:signal transduction histidine kinase/ActR/RegA family two-component response regulator
MSADTSVAIQEAEARRRRRAALVVGAVYLVSNLTFLGWALIRGESPIAWMLGLLVAGNVAMLVVSLRGGARLAGYSYALSAMAAVTLAPLLRGNPGFASFYVIVGVMLGAVILPVKDAFVLFVLGGVAELIIMFTPVTRPELAPLATADAQGLLLYLLVGLIGIAMAASIKQLVDDLLRRDREAQAAIRRAEELSRQLEHSQRMEALGRLAGGIAHDFNNLLTVMQSCSSLIAAQLGPKNPAKDDLTDLDDAIGRASALSRQLLAFARRDVVPTEAVDVRALLTRLTELLRRLLGQQVELSLQLPEVPCHVTASASQLEQVLMNLAVNARDAMGGAGRLTVTLKRPDEKHCVLEVRDTGPGLRDDVKARIFEPFFTTKGGQGTGLGLSTVYGIVTRLGGTVTADGPEGQGTTFVVTLPVTTAPVTGGGAPVPAIRGALSILVVDDEPVLREQIVRMLVSAGHQARAVGSAAAALAEPGLASTDVLVTDLQLGLEVTNGVQLATRLLEGNPSLRVVLISGFTAEPAATAPLLARGATFLAKPFSTQGLLAAVTGRPASTPQA